MEGEILSEQEILMAKRNLEGLMKFMKARMGSLDRTVMRMKVGDQDFVGDTVVMEKCSQKLLVITSNFLQLPRFDKTFCFDSKSTEINN